MLVGMKKNEAFLAVRIRSHIGDGIKKKLIIYLTNT